MHHTAITINAEAAPQDAARAIQYLTAIGFNLIAIRQAQPWDGQPPQTLIIASGAYSPETTYTALGLYCAIFKQDSLALRFDDDGSGVLLGTNPQGYSFNAAYFNDK
jgi:hypothetical protein